MAKRKRLSFDGMGLDAKSMDMGAPPPAGLPNMERSSMGQPNMGQPNMGQAGPPSRSAPIAQVVGDSSAQAALAALTAELEDARLSGRLILRLALAQIDDSHLTRDRMRADAADMDDLIASLRERGQQMPIEVTALAGGQFGLISGWRRVQALRHLAAETSDPRFATVLAIVRAPESLAHAYRAMVEENEIRAGISYYERARIAALAAEAGVYPDARAAIAGLFAAASRAKRSKIGSFLTLWQHLDARLRFAPAISERLGLALAKALEGDADFARRLNDRLRKAQVDNAADEVALLEKALAAKDATPDSAPTPVLPVTEGPKPDAPFAPPAATQPDTPPAKAPHREEIRPGIWLETSGGFSQATLVLSGARVDGPLRARLVDWLRAQG